MTANRNKRRNILKIAVVVSIAITGCVQTPLNSTQKIDETKKLSVSDLDPKKIVGKLGYPLGTVVHVKGVVINGDTIGTQMYEGKKILRVELVNDKPLSRPADFTHQHATQNLKIGDRFEFIAHESGAFVGQVQDPWDARIENDVKSIGNFIHVSGPRFSYSSAIEIHDWKIPTPKKPS